MFCFFFAVSKIIIKTGSEATDSDIAAEICDGKGEIESVLRNCAYSSLCKTTRPHSKVAGVLNRYFV